MKKFVNILIVLILTVGVLTGCGSSKDNDKNSISKNEFKNIKFENEKLEVDENNSTVITKVTNKNDHDINIDKFNINIKDEDGKTIIVLEGYVGETIKKDDSKVITSNVDIDLSNAKKFEYEIIK